MRMGKAASIAVAATAALAVALGVVGLGAMTAPDEAQAKAKVPAKVKIDEVWSTVEDEPVGPEVIFNLKKVKGAKRYQYQIARDKKFKKKRKVATEKGTYHAFSVSDVVKTRYYARARAGNSKHWGPWSKVKRTRKLGSSGSLDAAYGPRRALNCTHAHSSIKTVKTGGSIYGSGVLIAPTGKSVNINGNLQLMYSESRLIQLKADELSRGVFNRHLREWKQDSSGVYNWVELGGHATDSDGAGHFDWVTDSGETFSCGNGTWAGAYVDDLLITCEVCDSCGYIKRVMGDTSDVFTNASLGISTVSTDRGPLYWAYFLDSDGYVREYRY